MKANSIANWLSRRWVTIVIVLAALVVALVAEQGLRSGLFVGAVFIGCLAQSIALAYCIDAVLHARRLTYHLVAVLLVVVAINGILLISPRRTLSLIVLFFSLLFAAIGTFFGSRRSTPKE